MKILHLEERAGDGEILGWGATGNPTVASFGNAVQVWAIAQDHAPTVNDAALAFNVEPGLIRQAINDHPWLFIGKGDAIEHDGE